MDNKQACLLLYFYAQSSDSRYDIFSATLRRPTAIRIIRPVDLYGNSPEPLL